MTTNSFAGVARQRSELGRAMQLVEVAAAAPSASASWEEDLRASVGALQAAFDHHVAQVQAPEALLDQIVDQAPRLQRRVAETIEGHAAIAASISGVVGLLAAPGTADRHDQIRDAVLAVLLELARHRQKGADLIFDAYDVDIGGY